MKIKLTQGKYAIVDDKNYNYLNQFKWCYKKNSYNNGYAFRVKVKNNQRLYIAMHRLIMNCPNSKQIDHINRDGLDNREVNLRVCTANENNKNARIRKDNKSGYKGVSWYPNRNKWRCVIAVNKKQIYLGYFIEPKEAAKAYNKAAIKYFGEFANLNEI
jgi:hypothetical protein